MNVNLTSKGVFVDGVKQNGTKAFLYGSLVVVAGILALLVVWAFFSFILMILPFLIALVVIIALGSVVKKVFTRKKFNRKRR